MALSSVASEQVHATENTETAVNHLLDYCATHPTIIVASVSESKLRALFINVQQGHVMHLILYEMDHPHSPTKNTLIF